MGSLSQLMPIEQVQAILGYRGTSGVRSLVQRGELPIAGRGAHYKLYFREEDVLALMEARAQRYAVRHSLHRNVEMDKCGDNLGEDNLSSRRPDPTQPALKDEASRLKGRTRHDAESISGGQCQPADVQVSKDPRRRRLDHLHTLWSDR